MFQELNNFYVYEHWRPDKGVPFYVGKGRGDRAFSIEEGRNRHHKYVVNKLKLLNKPVEVRIIFNYLPENISFDLEKTQISYWRSRGIALTNKTDGGEGVSGYWTSLTEEESKVEKAIRRLNTLKQFQCPKARAAHQAGIVKSHSRQFKDRQSILTREALALPARRAKQSASQKLMWANMTPEQRAEKSQKLQQSRSQPEAKEKHRKAVGVAVKEQWAIPEQRAKRIAALKLANQRPEVRERRSVARKAVLQAKRKSSDNGE